MLEFWQLPHDSRCYIPTNDIDELASFETLEILLYKTLSLHADELECDFIARCTLLVVICNDLHHIGELFYGYSWLRNSFAKHLIKAIEDFFLMVEVTESESEQAYQLFHVKVVLVLREGRS